MGANRHFAAVLVLFLALAAPLSAQKRVDVAEGITIVFPDPWRVAEQLRNSVELVRPSATRGVIDARMLVVVELRRSHTEALQRLQEIAQEQKQQGRFTVIAGWPAFERRYTAPFPTTGPDEQREKATPPPQRDTIWVTTAVAVADRLVRLETTLRPDADSRIADEALAIGQGLQVAVRGNDGQSQRELSSMPPIPITPSPTGAAAPGPTLAAGAGGRGAGATIGAVNARPGFGELEVTASGNGQNVVVAANSGYAFSNNSGASFTAFGLPTPFPRDGDPSLGVGQSGTFYLSLIGFPNGTVAAGSVTGCSDSVFTSPTGQTFTFLSHAVLCPNTGAICFPDQEHLAADRVNAAAGNDQVYVVWRNFTPSGTPASCSFGSGFVATRIVCSQNSGATWGAAVSIGSGDFPRVTVGSDGFVYAAYVNGGNVMLNKFSQCSAGLTQQVGFPVTVSAFTAVTCPVPGLDRCNSGNTLSSPTAAVDDLDPTHVYVAWATSTGAGNENVRVADSVNGGATFPRVVTVNNAISGRRFMPWVSTYGGVAYASWYDRSVAAANNDQTRYFGGSAMVKGGNLVAGAQIDLSGATDAQCSTWPCSPRATTDSEGCTTQPQLAGVCSITTTTRCDFSSGGCPGGETCVTGGGCPKYGDYNGTAAIAGRRYIAWSSATPPPAVVAPGPGINVYADGLNTPSEFFVRDWTVSATNHDTGVEPSTNPVFYDTSDVWNQITSTPQAPVNDWVLGDPAQMGTLTAGDNYAFVRVSRRAAASGTMPAESVTAHFLTADFGLGTNFVAAAATADPTLTFAAGNLTQTLNPGYLWHLDTGASTHFCLAVEINSAGDPVALPTLTGGAPGPSDPLVLIDNNKAQRNLGTVLGSGASAGLAYLAMIHNAEVELRTMLLRFASPQDVCAKLRGVHMKVVGGEEIPIPCQGEVRLDRMLPGENRWIELRFDQFDGRDGELLPVNVTEIAPQAKTPAGAVNGFTIAPRVASLKEVIAAYVRFHNETFDRMVNGFSIAQAKPALIPGMELSGGQYRAALRSHYAAMQRAIAAALRNRKDVFGLSEAMTALRQSVSGPSTDALAVAHNKVLQRLDAQLTQIRKSEGDVADILQNVRWERAFLQQQGDQESAARADRFIDAYQRRSIDDSAYRDHLKSILPVLAAAARKSGVSEADLRGKVTVVEAAMGGPLARLQNSEWKLLAFITGVSR